MERLNTPPNPFPATLAFRIEPAADGAGETFRRETEARALPLYVYKTADAFDEDMADYVRLATQKGPSGWRVVDWVVTLTELEYAGTDGPPAKRGPLAKPSEWRDLTALVLGQALERAGTVVCEPVNRFELGFPADTLSTVYSALSRLGAVVETPDVTRSLGLRRPARSSPPGCSSSSSSFAASRAARECSKLRSTTTRLSETAVRVPRRHADEVETDVALVRRLLREQFPEWAKLPLSAVAESGTVNALYRLGDELVVRIPRNRPSLWSDLDDEFTGCRGSRRSFPSRSRSPSRAAARAATTRTSGASSNGCRARIRRRGRCANRWPASWRNW